MRGLTRLVVFGLVALLAGCGGGGNPLPSPPVGHPTDEQARIYLNEILTLARTQDVAGLCAHGGGLCRRNIESLGAMATVPADAPLVVGSRDVPDRHLESGGIAQGGRLLDVCGLDAAGKAYKTSVIFFGDGENWTAITAYFWTGMGVDVSVPAVADPARTPGPQFDGCPSGS